ncbi:Methyltransferase type 11 [Paraburkholderia piptadeniae]|uniref:Methyltransferase type 11 n=1 Tax=Paraburkholderia piptadeniae TaxID=1701573 RepID=A0A1N7SIJ9_9BURK|nr:methyltransferase domain-containing protein [Paraburkholderia piptadeniae]SIT47138.1 Methyltransferase type 11 [Paraburkholderia piptadeniae]
MKETSKAALRRSREPVFVQRYFSGEGVDIRPGADPLSAHMRLFPRVRRIVPHDNAVKITGLQDASMDFVHASHCLADQEHPRQALARWLDLLKPGGYAIVTVPDEDLYGKGEWPSRFNRNHKASYTVHKPSNALPRSINVIDLVREMSHVAECERIALVREHYDDERREVDQTAHGVAECAIEIVLRKRDVPSLGAQLEAASRARSVSESIAACKDAVRLYPYRFEAYHRTMIEMLRWNVPEEADAFLAQGVEHLPGEHMARLYRALHAISRGQLQQGFVWREALMAPMGWKRRTTVEPPSTVPAWTGQSLAGKSIAIWSEFGLGDEIFFLRFAKIFREQCGARRVTVVCQTPLLDLYKASCEPDDVLSVEQIGALPALDYWVFPHAIPAHLPLDLEALPATVPYLHAPRGTPSKLPQVGADKLKVGIVFKGNPTHENDHQRSMPSLSALDSLFMLEGVEFFSLQKGAGADEVADYAKKLPNFHDVGVSLNTMAETASAVEALDLVLTVDTSVAHVAGAMGKPVWLMLPSYGDWRWHYTREDSPWYPTMRLFRRPFGCDWSEVVARINGHMLQLIAERTERKE